MAAPLQGRLRASASSAGRALLALVMLAAFANLASLSLTHGHARLARGPVAGAEAPAAPSSPEGSRHGALLAADCALCGIVAQSSHLPPLDALALPAPDLSRPDPATALDGFVSQRRTLHPSRAPPTLSPFDR